MSGHTGGRNRVSPRCVISCESSRYLVERRTLYIWTRSKESRHCVFSCESSGYQTQRKLGYTGDRDKVYPRCGFSYESSSLVTGRRTLYTWIKSKVSHTVQGKSFSPVWVRWCDFKLDKQKNDFGQILHSKGFSRE